jgi:hypothetical protein
LIDVKFFFDAVSMNIEKKVQSLQANSGLYAVRSCQDRPVIVGWSTAPRGQVIEECLGATPEETGSRPRVLARTESSHTNPGRNRVDHPTITGRSWDKFGTLEAGMPLW